MNGGDELSLKDITFLRAIRDINGSPERYASTERGVTPATVTAITEATTLSEEEVAYRLDHPRLGKSGLVKVYEAGPPSDDSASLNSAELTESGEQAIVEAKDRDGAVDTQDWQPDEAQSEFDDMQEWEPAEVESGVDATAAEGATAGGATAGGAATPSGATVRAGSDPAERTRSDVTVAGAKVDTGRGAGEGNGRLAALEARIEQLEAENADDAAAGSDDEPEFDELAAEVATLQETTDRLESTLADAVEELEAIRESEYGAIDEKREAQFETAVKSMVAFHQLATEVLDVRVEHYEPAAGRADDERIEITRNRIGDALGVGESADGGGMSLDGGGDESVWPDPEEAARGGRVFSDEGESEADDDPEIESDAPDSGVYPPIGGDTDADADAAADAATREETGDASPKPEDGSESDVPESDVPDSGVYPPIGDSGSDDADGEDTESDAAPEAGGADDGSEIPESGVYPPTGEGQNAEEAGERDGASLPESIRPETDTVEGSITETAAEEGHVVDPIRSTGPQEGAERASDGLPIDVDPETALSVRRALEAADAAPTEAAHTDAAIPPEGEAYARIVDESAADAAVRSDDDGD